MTIAAENINKKPITVRHSNLKRCDDSIYRSVCPVCKEGILLVRRDNNTGKITNKDRCLSCGQAFIYEDLPAKAKEAVK